MFFFSVLSNPSFEINSMIIKTIFQTIWKIIPLTQKGTLNIIFVSDEEIQSLNKTYREKDAVTDVLSFHYFEDFSQLKNNDIAGELIFCESKILTQWQEYGLGSEKEFYKLLIHSILHILWYDHESDEDYEVMQPLEEDIWNKIFS
jgi:probable rRNA maturation factor